MNINNNKVENVNLINNSLNYDEIHWWQFPLTDFSVRFNDEFKKRFFHKLYFERNKSLDFAAHINKVSIKYGKNWNFKRQRQLLWAYKNETKFVPAWFVYEAALYLSINLSLIEKNVMAYITFRGKNEIYKPKLPVKVTPEFTAIAIHAMCDGCFTSSEKISYAQKEEENFKRFVNILQNIFGKYKFISGKRLDGTNVTYTPKIFATVISDYYNIDDFSSFNCKIPFKIKSASRLHKLAVLSSFIIDEGHTVTGIVFSSSSIKFLEDMVEILSSLGYKLTTRITYIPTNRNKLTQNHYKFGISHSSIKQVYLDLKVLFENFPSLHIGKKFHNMTYSQNKSD